MTRSNIPQVILHHLRNIEPEAEFIASLPLIKSSTGARYFAKVGSPSERDQYVGEAESLKAMGIAAPGLSPKVFAYGITNSSGHEATTYQPYCLSEYKNIGRLTGTAADVLAKRLATELHAYKSEQGFGFGVPTYCGATRQENGWYATWEECFSELLEGLLSKLKSKGSFTGLVSKGEEVRRRWVNMEDSCFNWFIYHLQSNATTPRAVSHRSGPSARRFMGKSRLFPGISEYTHNLAEWKCGC